MATGPRLSRIKAALIAALLAFAPLALGGEPTPEASVIPKDALEAGGRTLGEVADGAAQNVRWLERDLLAGIPAVRLLTSAALLVVIGGMLLLGLGGVRRWAGQVHSDEPQSWPRVLVAAASKPGAVILFAFGFYFALAPSLAAIADGDNRAAALDIASRFVDLVTLGGWFWLMLRLAMAAEKKLDHWAQRQPGTWKSLLVEMAGRVLRVSLPLLSAILLLPLLRLPPALEIAAQKLVAIALIAGVAGLIIRSALLFQRVVQTHYRIDVADNLQARKISTQVAVITKIIVTVVAIVALGSTLMVFDAVRQLGASLLASAGIAGIVLGFAAQKTLGNLLAGIQIAIAQPIRLDDVVIVEEEFGRVEEITLTYVVVKLWDLRRLVLPITYFVEKPFQNWTREGSKILGTVFLYLDHAAPIDALRAELERLVRAHPKWDGDVCALHVTDTREHVIEVRCLASAANAGHSFDLRCDLREALLRFLRERHPEALPRLRRQAVG